MSSTNAIDTYAIKVELSDGLLTTTATIDLTVKLNYPPAVKNVASLDLGS